MLIMYLIALPSQLVDCTLDLWLVSSQKWRYQWANKTLSCLVFTGCTNPILWVNCFEPEQTWG